MQPLLEKAIARRHPLQDAAHNALRLIDGEGDGLPGVILETFADRWLLSTTHQEVDPALSRWLHSQPHSCYWKTLDQHQKQSPALLHGPEILQPFLILENQLHFEISFQSGYSQGIFLDQRENRAEVIRRMRPGMTLLNTFAYTGAFSVAAASAGAQTTTLDLSQPYLDWAKRNLEHNHINPSSHHFCKGDTFHWLTRFAKQGRRFDAIILDPPTFSRDDKGKVFRVEKDFGRLAALAADCLNPGGWILCCTNHKGLNSRHFEQLIRDGIDRTIHCQHAPMPADFTNTPYLKSLWLEI